MSLASARSQLKSSVTHIMLRWEDVKDQWDDPVSRAFARDFLLPLEPSARATLAGMEKMHGMLEKARRDCSESS